MGGVVSLRDAQAMAGRPRKVSFYAIKMRDPDQALMLVERINQEMPEVHAALAGEFVEQLPDMQNSDSMISGISLLAIVIGGVGVLNTMLMAVHERTREIGVLGRWLAAQGHPRLIMREALIIGLIGGAAGIAVAFGLAEAMKSAPMLGESYAPLFTIDIFIKAIGVALLL
jgi:putative ABC transport system permease protein